MFDLQAKDLSAVRESSMCIGCGACVHADPTLTLKLEPTKQIWEPDNDGNELAASVCPAIQVDFEGLQARIFPGAEPGPYGVVDTVMLAQSTNLERNRAASSGGLIKELLVALLERPDVDGAIVLKEVSGLDFYPTIIRSTEEVDDLPGSIYHNLPKDRVLSLLKSNPGRYVLVGIPCEFEGIFQYIFSIEPHLESRIHSTIGLLCGWQYSYHALRAICQYKKAPFDKIERISYRGDGPVGKLRAQTPEGEMTASRRVDFAYQVAFDRTFNTPRCHLCINHANFLADVVVGDAWLPSTVGTKTGISLIINRKPEMTAMLRRLASDGRIVISDVSTEEIKESQKPRIAFGNFSYAYAEYRKRKGLHTPEMIGPNRPVAELVPEAEVEEFYYELIRKLELQWERRYRFLYWRKATKELPKLFQRYWEWFTVRILRIKSLKGEREELSRDQVSMFR
jgi:coenzyme F420 hydrogenase subunit beta